MKYEEIKIDESYEVEGCEEKVIAKSDNHKSVTTIDRLGDVTAWNSSKLCFFNHLPKELPEEGLLVNKKGSLVYKLSDDSGYGFAYESLSYFSKGWRFYTNGHWQPATPEQEEQFIEMIKKECEKHGLFEDTKIEMHADDSDLFLNTDSFKPEADPTEIFNKNGQIFYKGKFAKPLKESTLDQVTDAVKDIADFTIEETITGLIILTPINKWKTKK